MKDRPRLTRQERRLRLLAAGRQLFGERGYLKTEVGELARRAGVTKPILYDHFPNGKTEVFIAVLDEHVQRLLKVLWEAMSSSEDPRQRLHDGLGAYVKFADENPEGFRLLMQSAAEVDHSVWLHLHDARNVIVQGLASTIGDVMRARSIDPTGAPIYAHALLGAVESVVGWWLAEGKPDRETVTDYLLAFTWRGFDGLPRDPSRFHKAEN
ncbi:MAG TPA: TetR/AcrR family transcriptional regulator [Actinomycetota bacterium]|nr:TetR/AcrR family transcriptional regulator [Actinomycetota bacterium]